MRQELFGELMASLTQTLDHADGRRELRTTILPSPRQRSATLEGTERWITPPIRVTNTVE